MSIDDTIITNIYYININYACNSHCVYCYSHNTKLSKTHEECSLEEIISFLDSHEANVHDKIIINGGEPLLYSNFTVLLKAIEKYESEIVIYTNGRLLDKLPAEILQSNIRFVVPIHGCREVHERVTMSKGSYDETFNSIMYMSGFPSCLIDLKFIINHFMIGDKQTFQRCLNSFYDLKFNGMVHIVKMADTVISIENNCKTIDNNTAAIYTKILFDYWKSCKKSIKMYDTCIKALNIDEGTITPYNHNIRVLFKDCHLEKEIKMKRSISMDCNGCPLLNVCQSAVDECKVLLYKDDCFSIDLE